jgi:geranylgeranyl diphosphate synthase type I
MDTMTAARAPRAVLTWGRDQVDDALRTAVDTLPRSTRRIAGFHLGWCDEQGNAVAGAGAGKAIRPTLTLLAAEAAGGGYAAAIPAAVAVELVHNHSLLHDDVIDGDRLRRHRPTAWSVFGIGSAIHAGDALLTLAFDVLGAAGGSRADQAVQVLAAAEQDLLAGQMDDLAFESRSDVGLGECMRMAQAKTGALMGCACALGALSANDDEASIGHARCFGEQLGFAFQLIDDILGIWGDPVLTGKPIHSDLSTRKKSLPVVAALASGTEAGRELAALYGGTGPLPAADLASAVALVTAAGGRSWAEAQATRQLEGALAELHVFGVSPRATAELERLARLVTTRDH